MPGATMSRRLLGRIATTAAAVAVASSLLAGGSPLAARAATSLRQVWSHTVSTGPGSAAPSTLSAEPFAGAVIADLFGDGRKEVVAGFPDGSVWAFDGATGSVLPGWPQYTGGPMHSSPSVADLGNDGREEVIAASEAGAIYVWNGDGSLYPGWPQHTHPGAPNVSPKLFGGVAVGDLFGDGNKELVANAFDQHLWAWSSNGRVLPGFPIHTYDSGFDTPTLVDLEHRGQLDILAGFDSSGPPWDPWPKGGEMWAFRPTGCVANAYTNNQPCVLPGWPRTFNQTPWASSAAGDLFGNGSTEIVEGTGLNFPAPAGEYINAWTASGSAFGSWPQSTGGQNMASPAVGDLFGTGQRDVVELSGNGDLYGFNPNGTPLAGWPVHMTSASRAYPSIAPISATQNGVWILDGATLKAFNGAGQLVLSASGLDWGGDAAPTVGDIGGGQLSVVTLDQTTSSRNQWTVRAFAIPGATRMLPGAWPTFHGNAQESGTLVPTATMQVPGATQSSTGITLHWSLDAGSVPATEYILWARDSSQGTWVRYGHTPATSMPFFGIPGHSYSFVVQAANQSGMQDAPFSTATVSTAFAASATWATPFKEMYGVDGHGVLLAASSAPMSTGLLFPFDIVRGVALEPSGLGGYVLDGFGGIHPFGDAPAVTGTFYKNGWDICRGIALRPDGHSGYVVDGWGGLHPFGASGDMAPSVTGGGWWPGWDIARGVVVRPDGQSGYVLDGWGGIHPFGTSTVMAPPVADQPYWPGWDIARRLALRPDGTSGYLLDGWGGVHPFGVSGDIPPPASGQPYWPHWDIARGLVMIPGSQSQGYIMDGWGGVHPFNNAPDVQIPDYTPGETVHDLAVA